MLDKMLVTHCAPTLSGLKTAGMFSYTLCGENVDEMLDMWNTMLNPKGVSLHVFNKCKDHLLIYVCRMAKLSEDISKECVQDFLYKFGYIDFSAEGCIKRLKNRFEQNEKFPHEIGLFLGYPLEDVKDFIENSGKNCKFAGYWKVYSDEAAAMKQFRKFKKCKDIYNKLYENRVMSVYQLTVSV